MSADTWPNCPNCRRPMWRAQVGAPQQIIYGCSACDTTTQADDPDQLVLFEVAS